MRNAVLPEWGAPVRFEIILHALSNSHKRNPRFASFILFVSWVILAAPAIASNDIEIKRLCDAYAGALVSKDSSRKTTLSCDQIREQYIKQLKKYANEGPFFGGLPTMIRTVRHRRLNEIKVADLEGMNCTITITRNLIISCEGVESFPKYYFKLMGNDAGYLARAEISLDLISFKREMIREIQSLQPTNEYLDFYIDILISVGTAASPVNERYFRNGKKVTLVMNYE